VGFGPLSRSDEIIAAYCGTQKGLAVLGTAGPLSFGALVFFGGVLFIVTLEVASAVECAGVLKLQTSRRWVGAHDGCVEVYQMAVVRSGSLRGADAVRIVTCRAWNLFLQVFLMLRETFIVQNAVSTVTSVAQLIRITALLRKIGCFIPIGEEIAINGAVGALRARRAV